MAIDRVHTTAEDIGSWFPLAALRRCVSAGRIQFMIDTVSNVAGFVKEGKLKPHVSKVYALAETPLALQALLARNVVGKVVIRP